MRRHHRWILALAPKRQRYGDEVLDLLATSRRPWADTADLAGTVVQLRAEQVRNPSARCAAAVLTVIGLIGTAWAVPQLQHGLAEVPMHWWSTLAALPAALGASLLALSLLPSGWRWSQPG